MSTTLSFSILSLPALIIVFITLSVFLWLGWRAHKHWKRILLWRIRKRGQLGEYKAIKLLRKNGYKILDSQIVLSGQIQVNKERLTFDIRPDFLVEKDGVQFLAEVKTGTAGCPSNKETRRQLLEYAFVTETSTIILVDVTNDLFLRFVFPKFLFLKPNIQLALPVELLIIFLEFWLLKIYPSPLKGTNDRLNKSCRPIFKSYYPWGSFFNRIELLNP